MKIDQIADKLNKRPLKVLNFMTPKEAFLGECETYGVVPNFAVRA
jgi:IS30 family transposase